MSQHQSSATRSSGGEGSVMGAVLFVAGIFYLVGLFASVAIGAVVLAQAVCGATLLAISLRGRESLNGAAKLGAWISGLSMLAAGLCAPAVAYFYWLPYYETALAAAGGWLAGSVLVLLSGNARWLSALLSVLLAAALLTAVVTLPVPDDAEDPEDTGKHTTIIVRCIDQAGNPVGEVPVYFQVKFAWQEDPPLPAPEDWEGLRTTGSVTRRDDDSPPGEARWTYKHDPKARVILVRTAGMPASEYRPLDAGFEPAGEALADFPRGREVSVTLRLKERRDPRHTYVELLPTEAAREAIERQHGEFDPWAFLLVSNDETLEGRRVDSYEDLPGAFAPSSTERGPLRVVFRVPADTAMRPMYLYLKQKRVLEDGYNYEYEFRKVAQLGPLAAGERSRQPLNAP